jgi:3'(2'), 5'-bisphosphate nucleotidase
MNKESILENYITVALGAAIKAGKVIMEVYSKEFEVEFKEDDSPLTIADKRANELIYEELETTSLPILSEEGREIPFSERRKWDYFWMVDPLDGTKEFIKKNGEFTVNIALMKGNVVIYGIIYVPVRESLYFGGKGFRSYKLVGIEDCYNLFDQYLELAAKLPLKEDPRPYTVIGSRSHLSKETEDYFEEKRKEKGEVKIFSIGSSLKLCMIAEGRADEYPRFAPTMEWDTAAGQAIIEGAGKKVYNYKSGAEMAYNKENLLNDWFLAKAP